MPISRTLPDYSDALDLALQSASRLNRTETIALEHASDRVLAGSVLADRDLPPFNRAMMDGYAIHAADFTAGKSWPVAATVAAGSSPDVRVPSGSCVAIATGAALPTAVDTVIPHEQSDRGDHQGKPVHFTIQSITKGHAVHPRGADAKANQELIAIGTVLKAQHLGIAASVGAMMLTVAAKPRIIILTSGDEVAPPHTPLPSLTANHIRNSNQPMIRDFVQRMGGTVLDAIHLPDELNATVNAVDRAVKESDLVITIGGVSVGERDHFPAAFDAANMVRSLEGASIQPGRPIVVGRTQDGCVVVGLPGNPVSALACSCLFIWPIVRQMLGITAPMPWRTVELVKAVKPNPHRRAFRPAVLIDADRVEVPSWAGSGDLAHTARTDGLLELPVQTDAVQPGKRLRFLAWP